MSEVTSLLTGLMSQHQIKQFDLNLRHLIKLHGCDGTLTHTLKVLKKLKVKDIDDVIALFEYRGGFCDCEVLMNVIDDDFLN